MSCLMLLLLTAVIGYFGAIIAFFLAVGAVPLAILCLVLIPLAILFTWRIIYPWLVRMGRWSAQLRNLIVFALVLTALGVGIGYIAKVPTLTLPVTLPLLGNQIPYTVLILVPLFLFLLLLAVAVWVVRLWRRGWPLVRNFFWDTSFRIVALFWRILVGIPLGITWFLYHPPLRWLIAALLFYLRGIAAAAAWLVYNPPLRSILKAVGFITGLIGRLVAAILYNPPILWLVQAILFVLRVIIRPISAVIYGILSWWPITGVKGTLRQGLTTESKSYQDYKYAGTGPL
jgi:hypothetical protein